MGFSDGIDPSRVAAGVDPNDLKNTDPNYPGCCFRFCCPPCSVYAYEGDCTVNVLIALVVGCWFTMFCWNPRVAGGSQPTTVIIQQHHGQPDQEGAYHHYEQQAPPPQQAMSGYHTKPPQVAYNAC